MPREIHTVVYDAIIKEKNVRCVYYAALETSADPIYGMKHIMELRKLTGIAVGKYLIIKGYATEQEARKRAEENG